MKRRTLLAGAGASLLAGRSAWGQQRQVPRIALVATALPVASLALGGDGNFHALLSELTRLGYAESRSVSFERYSTAGAEEANFPQLAKLIVDTAPDVVFVVGVRMTLALKAATLAIPIVFVATAPIEFGVVTNLPRPGRNLTGFANDTGPELGQKRIQCIGRRCRSHSTSIAQHRRAPANQRFQECLPQEQVQRLHAHARHSRRSWRPSECTLRASARGRSTV